MAHGKSLGRQVGPEVFDTCQLHEPVLPRSLEDIEILSKNVDPLVYAVALQAGKVAVSEAFADFASNLHSADVFPDKLIESRRSAHGVTFGRLLGERKTDANGKFRDGRIAVNVAIKPFNNPADAVNEMLGYETIRGLHVPTFEPVGIFPASQGDHFIGMTVKNDKLQSLDRMRWVVGRAVDSEKTMYEARQNDKHLQGIAETLAYVHANGVYHPDGQIKNYVVTPSDKIGIIDTEGLVQRELGDEDAAELAWDDINKLVKSLVINSADDETEEKMFGVGMLANMSLNHVRNSIEELIIHPYVQRLEEISQTAGPEQQKQIQNLCDGLLERYYSEEEWPQHFIDANK